MTCAQGLLRLLWGGTEVGVLRDCVHPQQRKGKDIVRRATIAVLKDSGTGEIEYILRDLSKIAPV